jgi:hypothetical protein
MAKSQLIAKSRNTIICDRTRQKLQFAEEGRSRFDFFGWLEMVVFCGCKWFLSGYK